MKTQPLYKQLWIKWIFFVSYGYLWMDWVSNPIIPQDMAMTTGYKLGWIAGGSILYPFVVMGGILTDYHIVAIMVLFLVLMHPVKVSDDK